MRHHFFKMPVDRSEKQLIRLLQNAYSGEMAAAIAYRGHALASTDSDERNHILKIENEEWEHRRCLGIMLKSLNSKPRLSREIMMGMIGISIYTLCRLGGWLNMFNLGWYLSMYGAGKLEQGNIIEYEVAADLAIACGEDRFVSDLIHMAEVEWDHEFYFRSKAVSSKWAKYIRIWPSPLPRDSARASRLFFQKSLT